MKNLEESLDLLLQIKKTYIDDEIEKMQDIYKSGVYIFIGKIYLLQKNINQMKVMRKIG